MPQIPVFSFFSRSLRYALPFADEVGKGELEGDSSRSHAARPTGFALVSALAFLLVITLIGVSLFLGVNLQQKAAGNSLQKTRALQLANSVTLAAERWITRANPAELGRQNCRTSSTNTTFRACYKPPKNPAQPLQWSGKTTVSIKDVLSGGSPGVDKYYAQPGVWINYLGPTPSGSGDLYRINAYAWGGNEKSLAVTEAVFYVGQSEGGGGSPARNLGN